MFAARCIGVSLAVFFLLYVILSITVSRFAPFAEELSRRLSPRRAANLLFGLRMLPLCGAAIVTLAVTVPSFILLEPRHSDEWVGVAPLMLTICCLFLFGFGLKTALNAQKRTTRLVSMWLEGAKALEPCSCMPVFLTGKNAPTLTVVGLRDSKVLISAQAMSVLAPEELGIALRHEIAHVRSRDNLKKLLLQFSIFPGMKPLDHAWSQAAEVAADDEAAGSLRDALDLAAALVKLSRCPQVQPSAELASALFQSSAECLRVRVQRLFAWDEAHQRAQTRSYWWIAVPALAALLIGLVFTYPSILVHAHMLTEWLVQ
ncbi:MAG TPA: hypothetical protein VH437_11595 [Terriglobales bacterium]|jgi:Zn-dependent protease with chaperone function